MARQRGVDRIPMLHIERAARRLGFLLADHLFAVLCEDTRQLTLQEGHFVRREQVGQEQVALLLELGGLRWREFHGSVPPLLALLAFLLCWPDAVSAANDCAST